MDILMSQRFRKKKRCYNSIFQNLEIIFVKLFEILGKEMHNRKWYWKVWFLWNIENKHISVNKTVWRQKNSNQENQISGI